MICKKIYKHICLFLLNNFLGYTRFFFTKRIILRTLGHKIGTNTKIVGPISITSFAILEIGSNCWIGSELKIRGHGHVIIGNNCDISDNVTFLTGSHLIGDEKRRAGVGTTENIKINNGCWIGANSTIVGGVTVGESSIIGTCSLVLKNVEKSVIVGGNPAKTIKKL